MNLRSLFTEQRAVSPVIGVILMVAITVILAAVIGTFVLGLGNEVSQTTPQVAVSFDLGATNVTATHEGGDTIPSGETVALRVNSTQVDTADGWAITETLEGAASDGDTVRVVWTSGDNSAILAQRTL